MEFDSVPPFQYELKSRFATGVLWYGASSIITSVVRLLILAVLARLLMPKDFGLFSICLILVDLGNDIGDFGSGPAIIQRKHINQRFLSTLFWGTIAGGICIFIISALAAPLFVWFFKEKLLAQIIVVSSLSFIIRPSGFVHRAILQKELAFNRIAIIEIGSAVIWGMVSIGLAIKGFGVWSLVYGLLAHRIADVSLVWCMCKYRPALQFDMEEMRNVLHFIKNVSGERISFFISSRMDYIIVGRLLGPTLLGYYTLASEITNLPQKRISAIISTVAFPTFSYFQDQSEALRSAYIKVNKTISMVAFPILACLIVLAPEIVHVIFGKNWDQVIVPMQILCIVGAIKSIMHNNGMIIYIKNRPKLAFHWGVIQMITIPLPLFIGSYYGIVGVSIALTITFIIYFFILQNIINSLLNLKIIEYLRNIIPFIVASFMLIVLVKLINISIKATMQINDIIILSACSFIAIVCYAITINRIDYSSWKELISIIKGIIMK